MGASVRKISHHTINERVKSLLHFTNKVMKHGVAENAPETTAETLETAQLLRKLGAAGIVLLKNENNVLPFRKDKTVAVIGPNAKFAAYSGGGSANLLPYYAVTPFEGISSQASDVRYTLGAIGHKKLPGITEISRAFNGSKGLTVRVFRDPPTIPDRQLVEELHVRQFEILLSDYSHPSLAETPEVFYLDIGGTLVPTEDGIYDFGVAVCGTAQLFVDGQLVVDNTKDQVSGDSFFGSGTVEVIGQATLKAGKEYKLAVQFGSSATSTLRPDGASLMTGGGVRIGAARRTDAIEEIAKAVDLAKDVDQVVVCAGLNSDWESEGYDRENMDLPLHMNALIEAVARVNPNTVVVLQSGTPVSMPWAPLASAIVQAWYGGNETGNAIADVLFGNVNPSGKLPLTFPVRNEDNPAFLNYRSDRGRTLYGEDVYVGYRFYEKTKKEPLFPFGHGLSYTNFNMWHAEVLEKRENGKDKLVIAVNVKNTGTRAGGQVVQVYVSPRSPSIGRPPKELKGFTKVSLQPGETIRTEVEVEKKYAGSFWDEERDSWVLEAGVYDVLVGDSSVSTPVKSQFTVAESVWWTGL